MILFPHSGWLGFRGTVIATARHPGPCGCPSEQDPVQGPGVRISCLIDQRQIETIVPILINQPLQR